MLVVDCCLYVVDDCDREHHREEGLWNCLVAWDGAVLIVLIVEEMHRLVVLVVGLTLLEVLKHFVDVRVGLMQMSQVVCGSARMLSRMILLLLFLMVDYCFGCRLQIAQKFC